MPWDFSNIFFGGDIYDTVLREILGVRPTGDPVKDSVYLVVLPLLTLYLFSSHVSGLMHLGKTKLKWVFMAIIFFFVVDRGYYPLLANYALFAFIALMIWGVLTFITSAKPESEGTKPPGHGMEVYNMDIPRERGFYDSAKTVFNKRVGDVLPGYRDVKDEAYMEWLKHNNPTAWAIAKNGGQEQEKKKKWFGG